MSCQRGNTLYIGYDESNHGQYPEICVAVYSFDFLDTIKRDHPLAKTHSIKDNFSSHLIAKDYSFLRFDESDEDKTLKGQRIGRILGSLTHKRLHLFPEHFFNFVIDGEWKKPSLDYARDFISELNSLEKERVIITCGKDYDKLIPLVHLADEIAYWHFKNSNLEKLTLNTHLVPFLLSE
jgi:hypothetical protein